MKKKLVILFLFFISLFFQPAAQACTAFGAITTSGTIIGKNRDFAYSPQQFSLVMPSPKYQHWLGNTANHQNKFYAIIYADDVSMGVNEKGLTAIEEDSPNLLFEHGAIKYKALQRKEGIPDGKVLHGILQNFNTVDEMIPYLSKIFSVAAPNFYQFSDAKKILTVEVAKGKNKITLQNKFTYKVISKNNEHFTHTNTYLSPEFSSLNSLAHQDSLLSAKNRLKTINNLISRTPTSDRNIDNTSHWFLDTYSNVSKKSDPEGCLNTSIFRSDLQNFKAINMNTANDTIYGTLASMIISNHGDFKNSHIYLILLDSITTEKNGSQLIKYRKLYTTLEKLFDGSKLIFTHHQFLRNAPVDGICH
jgi:hypothetical protein